MEGKMRDKWIVEEKIEKRKGRIEVSSRWRK